MRFGLRARMLCGLDRGKRRRRLLPLAWILCLGLMLMQLPAISQATPLVVKVADDRGYPPYIFLNSAGQPDGFELDMARLLEQETGLTFEWTLTEFGRAVEMLRAGQVALIPGMNVTEERQREFLFSRPYLQDKGVLFVPADSYHISRLADLSGRRIGVQQGEVAEQFLNRSGISPALYLFGSQRELLQAVADRKIDAAVCNYYSGHYFLYQLQLDEKVKVIGEPLFTHPFAVAATPNNGELLEKIDAALAKLQATGRLDALQEKWFGRQDLIFGLPRHKLRQYAEAAVGILVACAVAFFLLIQLLRKKIAEATREIQGQRDELNKAYQELAAQNEELLAQDEMLGNQNKILLEQETNLNNRNRVLEALQNTTVEMLQTDAYDELFGRIVARAAQLAETTSATLDTWDAASSALKTRAAMGFASIIAHVAGQGVVGEVVRTGKSLLIEDYRNWSCRLRGEGTDALTAVLGVPLLIHDEVRGVLTMDHTESGRMFSPEQIAAVEQLARIASVVLAQADARDALRLMAYHDPLTGLPNRRALLERLGQELSGAVRGRDSGAILLLDIDNFKITNDSLGHACGDELLQELSRRLQACVGRHMVARISGDEFIVLLEDVADIAQIEAYARSIMDVAGKPFSLCGQRIFCSVSIGIVRYPTDGADADELFRDADTALHAVKNAGKNSWRFFDSSMREAIYRRMQLEHSLREALERQELSLVYQPVVELGTKKIVGFESLLRWHSSEYGVVAPQAFIPVAEETGWIVPIGQWALKQACRFAAKLKHSGYENLFIAVNLSVRQLVQENFVAVVEAVLSEANLPPESLELEITESVLMESFDMNLQKLRDLRDTGVKLALDDFGTGYSSLTYLKNLPINKVKIDKSFVDDIAGDAVNSAILRSIVQMSHRLGMTVVAEGVETEEQRHELIGQGCDMMQGYLFSRPVDAERICQMLKQKV